MDPIIAKRRSNKRKAVKLVAFRVPEGIFGQLAEHAQAVGEKSPAVYARRIVETALDDSTAVELELALYRKALRDLRTNCILLTQGGDATRSLNIVAVMFRTIDATLK